MEPIVALVGRPNVGKSTLFNRLTKSKNAIVDNTPGITRDRLYGEAKWDDNTFIIIDTGGLDHFSADPMATSIIQQAYIAMEEADIILFITDARHGLIAQDYEIANILRKSKKPVLLVVNKVDEQSLEHLSYDFYALGFNELFPVSSVQGYGLNDLQTRLNVLIIPEEQDHKKNDEDICRIAVIGKPNAGKSSMINKLAGKERLLVSDIPGTTRDAIDTTITFNNKPYIFIDTAGIRKKARINENIEYYSVVRALKSIKRADVTLLMIDASEGISEQDTKLAGYISEANTSVIICLNKWDTIKMEPKKYLHYLDTIRVRLKFIPFAPMVTISALTGRHLNKIFPVIDKVYNQFSLRISTNRVNNLLKQASEAHTPPYIRNYKRLKFYYATQISTKPPTFIIFTNYPKDVHFSYERFLSNQIREHLGLKHTPIRLFFKQRKSKRR